jgi:hypothetical protein
MGTGTETMASLISGVHGTVATATDRAAARVRRSLLLVLAVALALALGAVPAGAVPLVKTGTFASAGSGAGQVSEPQGVAVDQATGDVYVADRRNHRIDKFDAQGNFILTFGREVDQTSGGDVCTAASGDTCQAGANVAGDEGQILEPAYVAVDNSGGPSAGDVYVGDAHVFRTGAGLSYREGILISKFDSSGSFISANEGRDTVTGGLSKLVSGIAVDPGGNLWVSDEGFVYEFSQSGKSIRSWSEGTVGTSTATTDMTVDASSVFIVGGELQVVSMAVTGLLQGWVTPELSLVTNHSGAALTIDPATDDLYVGDGGGAITHYDSSCAPVTSADEFRPVVGCSPMDSFGSGDLSLVGGLGLDPETTTLYASDRSADQIVIFGPPAAGAPVVDSESASSAGSIGATLAATITPLGHDTACEVQYVDDAAFQGSGYATATGVPCAVDDLGSGFANQPAKAVLSGLAAGTSYHYRFVASNSAGATDGADRSFTTEEAASGLPDGRAYEMVTPADKNSGQLQVIPGSDGRFGGEFAAVDGSRMAFMTLEANSSAQFAGLSFLAARGAGGWSSQGQVPPQSTEGGFFLCPGFSTLIPAYASDLSKNLFADGYFQQFGCGHDDPALVAGEPQGVQNLFVHDNRSGSYQLVSVNPVSGSPADANYDASTPDLSHVVFDESAQLTAGAPSGEDDLYDWSGGSVRLVSSLSGASIAGGHEVANDLHAISADGSKIFFQAGGDLYVRKDGAQTSQVDASQGSGPGGGGRFWVASVDGEAVFFTDDASAGLTGDTVPGSGQNLYRYDVGTGHLTDLTPGGEASVSGVSGIADDGSYVYFVATGSLASGAIAGQPNLYVTHAGATAFIATLPPSESCDWEVGRVFDCARVSSDGTHIAFGSYTSLTSIDTAGNIEIYLYDARTRALACASCSHRGLATTGAAAISTAMPDSFFAVSFVYSLPGNLSADGSRMFFNTSQPLVARDTDGTRDVYEYEQDGSGSCKTAGGCTYLISSGVDPTESIFLGASANGDDVFFSTGHELLPQDIDGSTDIYDARVNGGFAPSAAPAPCAGEGCRGPTVSPPSLGPAASATFAGPGNLVAPVVAPVVKSKPLTRAQQLAKALGACRKKPKKRRHGCEVQAKRRFGARSRANQSSRRSFVFNKGAK